VELIAMSTCLVHPPHLIARTQVEVADAIVVNKSDLATTSEQALLREVPSPPSSWPCTIVNHC
jgi:G3E family GTPase